VAICAATIFRQWKSEVATWLDECPRLAVPGARLGKDAAWMLAHGKGALFAGDGLA
jgi:hypothetical protein